MNLDEQNCLKLRQEIFKVGFRGGMAHFASCFSCVEILYVLYNKGILKIDKNDLKNQNRDRLILSKGHGALSLYANLVMAGIMDKNLFYSYLRDNTILGGEPSKRDLDFIETTTGSLGHGLSFGIGVAIGLKKQNIDKKVYVILGDGECEEGSIWEAALFATKFKLDNLIVVLDNNQIQKMGTIKDVILMDNWKEKFESFGFSVDEVDGHNVDELINAFKKEGVKGKPRLIIANTIKGKGISIVENNPIWHFKLPNKKELKIFLEELNLKESDLLNE